jgi:Protein of unknown function (DUF3306)
MSEPENFVARWSRLKRKTAQEQQASEPRVPPPPPAAAEGGGASAGEHPTKPAAGEAPPPPSFDPATLPPIESITADSDIRAFLQSGVPAQLKRAALRQAWAADPEIRDFIGLVEYQWDFNDPTAMPGFGPLEATDDVGKLVSQAMGKLDEAIQPVEEAQGPTEPPARTPVAAEQAPAADHPSAQVSGMPPQTRIAAHAGAPVETQLSEKSAALQQGPASAELGFAPNRRGHGSALPK